MFASSGRDYGLESSSAFVRKHRSVKLSGIWQR